MLRLYKPFTKRTYTAEYLQDLDRGGSYITSSALNLYVKSAFCVLKASKTEIVQTTIPWKILSLRLLQEVSQSWDSCFACIPHTEQAPKLSTELLPTFITTCVKSSMRAYGKTK